MSISIKITAFFVFYVLLFAAVPVFASNLFLGSDTNQIVVGDEFMVSLLLNTEDGINALEGRVVFPLELLEVKDISDGNSLVNFWVERPQGGSEIVFSGITPGGWKGTEGMIFSITFKAIKEGNGNINLLGARALLNDGAGTPSPLSTAGFELAISPRGGETKKVFPVKKDQEPPETFKPEITADQNLFDGQWFLVFAAADKGLGMAHYEVRESRQRVFSFLAPWHNAESPFVLNDQELRSYVFIKAVDKAGNERIMELPPRQPLPWYENWGIMILIAVLLIAIFRVALLWLWKSYRQV
ncbi:MAG: cohesin domain-containing protein [bacterium]|nr:cohesin domain-containing protein [bacterium]